MRRIIQFIRLWASHSHHRDCGTEYRGCSPLCRFSTYNDCVERLENLENGELSRENQAWEDGQRDTFVIRGR